MSFQWPLALWGLALIPAFAALYMLAQRRRARYAVRFTNLELLSNVLPKSPGWRRHLPPVLILLALSSLLLGLARPQATVQVPRERANVVLAIDTSGSMVAEDVAPDRLSAAREAAGTFLDRLPEGLRVGLVTFSSDARVISAPTDDHEAIRTALGSLNASGGTAMGDALARASEVSQQAGDGTGDGNDRASGAGRRGIPAAVVLLSDGANTSGETEPSESARRAREMGVPVFTVALGTGDGFVELPDESAGVRRVDVPPDTETLREIAETTEGRFFASSSGADLVNVYEDLGSRVGFVEEK
ncbi:MAG TPA: VWA domain-containing protein, partial [Rubrobacter sp.]|nr:VWA domain-containing protein [Rubrobacter sp.]